MPGDKSDSFKGQGGNTPYVPSWMMDTTKPLKKNQIKALKELGEPGHFRVNWRPNLSSDAYRDLKDRGFIEEHWTWASTTRPDVGITAAGLAAIQ